ncbi:MAG: hypothetical protein ACYTG5_09920 [Planctomycetota bacterium]|jgi:hypothetical protein
MASYQIRLYQPGDEQGILESFNRVFREVCGPEYVDRKIDFWHWQFEQNPNGHRISVAETDDGVIAAHYGGVPLTIASEFGDLVFTHIVDSFALPEHRAGLKRPGLFVETAYPWFDLCREKGDALMYGYPVKAAERVGTRYLEYNFLRIVDYLCRDVQSGSIEVPADVSIEEVTTPPADADALFARLAAERACLTRRDRAYLQWRYVDIPGDDYRILLARRSGELAGLMVLRVQHELIPDACTIADWVLPSVDAEVTAGLLARATEIARETGRKTLMSVFSPTSPEYEVFRQQGFAVQSSSQYLERRLTQRSYHPQVTADWLTENWWYTLGDSDLV